MTPDRKADSPRHRPDRCDGECPEDDRGANRRGHPAPDQDCGDELKRGSGEKEHADHESLGPMGRERAKVGAAGDCEGDNS